MSFNSEFFDNDASVDMGSSVDEVPHNIVILKSALTEELDTDSQGSVSKPTS